MPEAVATVSATPARLVGLDDRGAIEPDRRADLAWIARTDFGVLARQVWRAGQRII